MNFRSFRLFVLLGVLAAAPAHAAFHLFRIDQIYSNSDGEVQYVVLREATGANGENFWSGQQLVSTNTAGQKKTFVFPRNLASSSTASHSVLVATQAFAALNLVTPDFIIPARFIPTAGGTLDYASGVDTVSLPPLPSDGATAVNRNGTAMAATPKNFANTSANVSSSPVMDIEFYNQALDHYFISSLAPDIDALDTGRIAGWTRTGQSFAVFPANVGAGASASPVCRILIPPPANSHFFSASPQECADTLTKFPFMTKETDAAFFVNLPVTSGANAGACPAGTVPVYRVFNNRPDGNHRYTVDRSIRDLMVSKGGTAEGYGPDAVIMCASSAAAVTSDSSVDPPPDMTPPPAMCYPYYNCPP